MDELTAVLSGEMAERGAMTFARFMELALYAPGLGYYERDGGNVGRGGDFYTSVSVGPLFGELLAFQFARWLGELPRGSIPCLVEAGAHDGKLAADILGWLQQKRPELFARIEYWIIEPSSQRQTWQRETLQKFSAQVHWRNEFEHISTSPAAQAGELPLLPRREERAGERRAFPSRQFNGVIFSNELLDAFPLHRLGWDATARAWFEWGVDWNDGRFVWHRLAHEIGPLAPQLPDELLAVLPDGFTTEVSPAAEQWWRQAAGALGSGKLLAIDYGLSDAEFFSPPRAQDRKSTRLNSSHG